MDDQTADKLIAATHRVRTMAAFALTMLAVFLVCASIAELKGLRYIGSGINPTNTITVTGDGEMFAVPDIAEFSVTVQETAKDVKTAQTAATAKGNAIIDYLKGAGVEKKDIQTTDYSVAPQYEWSQTACPAGSYCPGGKQILIGYEVSQTVSVKVRDTAKAGDILAGVGSKGASNVSGLNFTVDDQKLVEAQARDKAIADAKAKAAVLAKSLGVSLTRIVMFNENSGGPIYYAKGMGGVAAMDSVAAPAPQIEVGQNKVTSSVTITYEIQ